MPQSSSNQKPTSHSAALISSDKDIGEVLWMNMNRKLDHKRTSIEKNTSISLRDRQSIPYAEQSATMAYNIVGNDDVSILPRANCCPGDSDKARELVTSTSVPGVQVYPTNTVDASQSVESRAEMETQVSPGGAAGPEIKSQTPVRTPPLTGVSDSNAATDMTDSWDTARDVLASSGFCNWKEGSLLESCIEGSISPSSDGVPKAKAEQQNEEQSKTHQSGIGTMGRSEKQPAGSAPEVQNAKPRDVKVHAPSVNASNNPEVLGSGEIVQYFNSPKFPAKWGTEEGIDIDSLLENVNSLDKMEVSEAYASLSSDCNGLSQDNASSTVREPGSCKFDQLFVYQIGTSLNDLFDQTKDFGGMDASHGLPPWTRNSSGVTGGPLAKDTTYSNEERLSTSSVQRSGLRHTSSPREDLTLSQCVSLSAVGHPVITGDYAPFAAQPAIQVGSVAVAERDRNKSKDNAEKWDTDADFSLNDGAREMTDEDRIRLGLHDGWPRKLSDINTGLPPITEKSWRELETKQTAMAFAPDDHSEVDSGRATADNPSAGTGTLHSFVDNVSSLRNLELDEPFKLFDPPEPKPMQQGEAASDMVDSGHNSAQLSAKQFHAANSKTEVHSVVDTEAHLTGVPEMDDTASPMKDTTKDMPADFGRQKWTGDDSVDQDTKYAKLVSSDSERPESSFESRDFILWTACYPDDPDKAREIEANTGVPGIRVYPVDVFFHATSNPQISNGVDVSQNSDNSRT